MRWPPKLRLVLFAAALCLATPFAAAAKQTVCTITVNSADEKETFRRHLPAAKYRFVELVERDRPDWLASACRTAVACDVLIVSGHYDGGTEFFRINSTYASSCPSPNWSASRAAIPARRSFRG